MTNIIPKRVYVDDGKDPRGVRISRTKITHLVSTNPASIGASYCRVDTHSNSIGPNTEKIIGYHSRLTSLSGLDKSKFIQHAYLAFNHIRDFRPEDSQITNIHTLDLAGNPITSLKNCPQCKELIVSSTLIPDLEYCPDSVEILRVGHSTHFKSITGIGKNVRILEISCTPNLIMDYELLPISIREIHHDEYIIDYDSDSDNYIDY